MKKICIALLGFAYITLCSYLSVAEGQETGTLMNGGFEESEEDLPKYWEFMGNEQNIIWDDETYFEGSRSIQISLQSKNKISIRQNVSVEASTRYDLGGMIEVDLKDGFAKIMVAFLDKKGDEIEMVSLPALTHISKWVYQSMWIKSPNGADVAVVICQVEGNGRAWFDDIHFTTKLRGGY